MEKALPVRDWMAVRGLSLDDLIRLTALERKVVEAIVCGRHTPTGEQRRRVAEALRVDGDHVFWGHVHQVDHMYGHGPQFGRSP
jgi:hypothetical protein